MACSKMMVMLRRTELDYRTNSGLLDVLVSHPVSGTARRTERALAQRLFEGQGNRYHRLRACQPGQELESEVLGDVWDRGQCRLRRISVRHCHPGRATPRAQHSGQDLAGFGIEAPFSLSHRTY